MKKIMIFVAAAVCALGLTACGKSDAEHTTYETQKITAAEQRAVGQILPCMGYFTDGTLENFEAQNGEIYWDEFTMDEVATAAEQFFGFSADGYGFYNAINSFKSAAESVGNMKKDPVTGTIVTGEVESYIDDRQIVVSVPVECENGSATAEIIFSNDMFMKLESASLTENYTIGQKMSKAGLNTLMGMGTVFIVLILISLLISLFGIIPKVQKAAADKKAAKNAASANEVGIDNAVNQIIANETAEDDTELVAVIAAAIAAYEGSGSADGYVVRSIRRRR